MCDDLRLFSIYNLPHISQVYFMFYGSLKDGFAKANEETLEVGLFDESAIPWDQLAFPVVTETLTRFFDIRKQGDSRIFTADIFSRPGAPLDIIRY